MLTSNLLKNHGLTVWIVGDKLRVAPPGKITPELAAYLKTNKRDIMAELLSPVIYTNPYPQCTPEARQESLSQVMDATLQKAFWSVKAICEDKQMQFKTTPRILILERRIETLQQNVLKGKASLKEFQLTACEWQRAAKAELN